MPAGSALLVMAAALALGQTAPDKTAQPAQQADSEHHRNALLFVETTGGKRAMQESLPELVRQAKAQMLKQFPNTNPRFLEEWGKRMLTRINVDDFAEAAANVYQKHLTNAELLQLIAFVKARATNPSAALPPEFQRKIESLLPKIMGEITGATTEIGARLGGEIGREIEKERPELASPVVAPAK